MEKNEQQSRLKAETSHPFQRLQVELAHLISTALPGEKLPAEPELAQQLGVSRATLREAMRAFEGQGLIRRRQGVGTFVVGRPQVIETGMEVLESIETMAQKIGLAVTMGDLSIQPELANEKTASRLGVSIGAPLVRISRVILAETRPVAFLVDVLPQEYLSPEELDSGFNGSVLDLLLRRGTPRLLNSHTEIQAIAASTEVSRALEIQRGDVLLALTASLVSEDGRAIDYSHSYFLPGTFRFKLIRRVGN